MPTRDHRRAQQVWRNNRRAAADRLRTQHARDLAHLATILTTVQGGSVQGEGLIVSRLSGAGGIVVWRPDEGRPVLHVLADGQCLFYEQGPWEQRLVELVAQEVQPHGAQ